MRQVLLTNRGATVARMPRPVVQGGCVLIRVRYSAVSIGTEISGLRANATTSPDAGSLEQAKSYSALLGRYLVKSVRDPRKAARRLSSIARHRIASLVPESPPPVRQAEPLGEVRWSADGARELATTGQGLTLLTDDSDWGYQAHTEALAVPEGHLVGLDLKGEITGGAISIGILDEAGAEWLDTTVLKAGRLDDRLLLDPRDAKATTLVISNAQAGSTGVALEAIAVTMVPPDPAGLPLDETGEVGFNLGYSGAGEVLAVGDGVSDLVPGDLVACAGAGKANHADYVVVPRNLVCRVPAGCDLRSAATATLGAIALQGVRRAEPALGECVCVIGLGLLGQITVQLLRASGCTVIGTDVDGERVERARRLGMDHGTDDGGALEKLVGDVTGGHGADRTLIVAATKSDSVVNLAMRVTRRKGRVVVVGDVGLNMERSEFYRKEIDLLMSTSYGPGRYDRTYEETGIDYPYAYVRWTENRNMQSYLGLIASGRLDVETLIDAVVPVDDAATLYQALVEASGTPPLGVLLEYPDAGGPLPEPGDATRITLRGHRKVRQGPTQYVLVGAGAFGVSMLVPTMARLGEQFFLRGVVSSDAVRGGNFARDYRVDIFTSDLQEVLDDPQIELLVIATRHCDHARQAIAGLDAGKQVFVEKPLALTWEELEKVAAACREGEDPPRLMVGFNRRFSPALRKLAEVLADRRSPLVVNYRLNGGYIPADHWVQNEQGGGRNIGEACHMYDVFRFLAGAPAVDVQASAIDPGATPYLRNDNFSATVSYDDGSIGTLVYTALGPKGGLAKERIEAFCDGEAYLVDDFKSLVRTSDGDVLWSATEPDKGHFEEMRRLGEALRSGAEWPIPVPQIVETSAVSLEVEDRIFGRHREDE